MDDLKMFEFEINNDDYRNVVRFNTFQKEKRMKFIFICVAISFFLIISNLYRQNIQNVFTFAISVAVVILFFVQVILTEKKTKKIVESKPDFLNVKRIIKITDNSLMQSNLKGDGFIPYPYDKFEKVFKIKDYYIFYTIKKSTIILPSRYANQDIAFMDNFLKDKLGERFILKKRG